MSVLEIRLKCTFAMVVSCALEIIDTVMALEMTVYHAVQLVANPAVPRGPVKGNARSGQKLNKLTIFS